MGSSNQVFSFDESDIKQYNGNSKIVISSMPNQQNQQSYLMNDKCSSESPGPEEVKNNVFKNA